MDIGTKVIDIITEQATSTLVMLPWKVRSTALELIVWVMESIFEIEEAFDIKIPFNATIHLTAS